MKDKETGHTAVMLAAINRHSKVLTIKSVTWVAVCVAVRCLTVCDEDNLVNLVKHFESEIAVSFVPCHCLF